MFETETIGFELADVTEQVALEKTEWNQTLSTGQNVTWVSGTYSTSKASLEANKNRIRMTEALDVTVGKTYAASIKWRNICSRRRSYLLCNNTEYLWQFFYNLMI